MAQQVRKRFWVEAGLAGAGFVSGILSLVWKEWIEILFKIDPDNGDGSAEWMIAVGFLLAAVVVGVLARLEWRRAAQAT